MPKKVIGFMGGCLHTQSGIPRQNLYYRELEALLTLKDPQVNLQIALGFYPSFDQLVSQTNTFLDRKKPDILFLFVRPFPLMPLQKLLVKYEKGMDRKGVAFHPALFHRKLQWSSFLTENQTARSFNFQPPPRFGKRDLNLLAGMVLGLHQWALKYVWSLIMQIHADCKERGTRLFVISPPPYNTSLLGSVSCIRATRMLAHNCERESLPFLNINTFPAEDLEADSIHLSKRGHLHLRELLAQALEQEISFHRLS